MNPDLALPIIASIGWLVVAATGLASLRLGWSRMIRMALVWILIFGGLFLIVEWLMAVRDTASGFV